jgi:O-antigen ligase
MVLLEILFWILIFILLPLGQIAKFDLGFSAFVTAFDIGIFLILIYWIFCLLTKKIKIKGAFVLTKPIVMFILVGLVSLLLNVGELSIEQFLVAFSYLFRWGIFALIYFIVVKLPKEKKYKLLEYLFYSGLILLSIGFIQVFLYPSLRNLYYLGWDEHMYRLFSTFLDPNFTGIYFVIIFLIGIYLYSVKKSKKYLVFCLLIVIGIFLTYSRTALVMLFASIVSFLVVSSRKKMIIPITIIILLAVAFFPKTFISENTNFLRTFSVGARVSTMQHGLKIFADHPLLGVGFNSYRYFQEKYSYEITAGYFLPSRASAGVENSFIFILATTGVVGFAIYIFLIIKIIKVILTSKDKQLAKVVFAIFMGVIVSSLFVNSLFYTFIMFPLWVLVGITENT